MLRAPNRKLTVVLGPTIELYNTQYGVQKLYSEYAFVLDHSPERQIAFLNQSFKPIPWSHPSSTTDYSPTEPLPMLRAPNRKLTVVLGHNTEYKSSIQSMHLYLIILRSDKLPS
jgi:hypothetical protein